MPILRPLPLPIRHCQGSWGLGAHCHARPRGIPSCRRSGWPPCSPFVGFPPPLVWTMWAVSEVAAMATDLAEFLGGAIGLSLLLKIPLLVGMAVTGVIVYAILMFQQFGFRPMELAIGGFVAAIGLSYLVEMLVTPVNWRLVLLHTMMAQLA